MAGAIFIKNLPNTKAHILSVTWTTGVFSESGRLKDEVELDRLPFGLALPVVKARAVDGTTLSFSGSGFGVVTLPSQDHITAGHRLQIVQCETSRTGGRLLIQLLFALQSIGLHAQCANCRMMQLMRSPETMLR